MPRRRRRAASAMPPGRSRASGRRSALASPPRSPLGRPCALRRERSLVTAVRRLLSPGSSTLYGLIGLTRGQPVRGDHRLHALHVRRGDPADRRAVGVGRPGRRPGAGPGRLGRRWPSAAALLAVALVVQRPAAARWSGALPRSGGDDPGARDGRPRAAAAGVDRPGPDAGPRPVAGSLERIVAAYGSPLGDSIVPRCGRADPAGRPRGGPASTRRGRRIRAGAQPAVGAVRRGAGAGRGTRRGTSGGSGAATCGA